MKKIKKILVSWISVYVIRILLYILKFLPEKIVYSLGLGLSRFYFFAAIKNRKLSLRNIEIAFSGMVSKVEQKKIAYNSFLTMGNIIIDTVRFKDFSQEKMRSLIDIEGISNLENALKKGKGVIAASAHLGSFTLMGARLTLEGYKAAFVARHARNKKIEKVFMELCRGAGQKIIFNRPVLTCMRLCINVLARNEVLIIEMDQNFGTEGLEVNFFGRPAMAATGPVKLSLSTGAVIVPMFVVSLGNNRHVIKIEPQVELTKSENLEMDIKVNSQKVISVIENNIKQYPGQWVNWIHKRWEVTEKSR